MASDSRKPKVVVLGGGIGALAAVMELTDPADWRDRFESITVYQMGWRLGGKGASGRNADAGQRIEEHGLHVWPGFYDNSFQLMRRCYHDLNRPQGAPLASWDEAFKPHHFVVVSEQFDGVWKQWSFQAPPNGQVPGSTTTPPDVFQYLVGGLGLMTGWFHQALGDGTTAAPDMSVPRPGFFGRLLWLLEAGTRLIGLGGWGNSLRNRRLKRLLASALSGADELSDALKLDAAFQLARRLASQSSQNRSALDLLVWLSDQGLSWLGSRLDAFDDLGDQLRRLWIQLDIGRTLLRGIVADRVLEQGFDQLDGEKFRDWMERHGASQATLDSALLRGLHDFVFAYENADPGRPNLAAGVALQLILRLTLAYKGAVMWKMQAGMGDVVFAPLYEVLKRRGVEFRFFHRVEQLRASGGLVSEIEIARQATPDPTPYEPLVDVNGLPCWPDRPRFDQLTEGGDLRARGVDLESVWSDWEDVEQLTLRAGEHFDLVLLGVPLGALPHVCAPLIASAPAWQQMVTQMKTVKTLAAQLWFTRTVSELGWTLPSPVLTAYEEPLETWADMTQTLAHETWSGAAPRSVAYFCGTMADDDSMPGPGPSPYPQQQHQAVREAVLQWLRASAAPLFPDGCVAETGELNWELLHAPTAGASPDAGHPLDSQMWVANVEPTARYVQSPAGATAVRLDPGHSRFDNLFLAGDWTRNDLNVGCVEAAVISGRRAAQAMLEQRSTT